MTDSLRKSVHVSKVFGERKTKALSRETQDLSKLAPHKIVGFPVASERRDELYRHSSRITRSEEAKPGANRDQKRVFFGWKTPAPVLSRKALPQRLGKQRDTCSRRLPCGAEGRERHESVPPAKLAFLYDLLHRLPLSLQSLLVRVDVLVDLVEQAILLL